MNWLDVVFIGLVAIGAAYGAWKGFVMLAACVVIAVVGIFAGGHFGPVVAGFLGRFSDNEVLCGTTGFIAVFAAVAAVLIVVAYLVRALLRRVKLGGVDRAAGCACGALAGFLVSVAVLLAAANASKQRMVQPVRESALAPYIARSADTVRVWISRALSDRIKRYLRRKRGIDLDKIRIPIGRGADDDE